MEEEEEKEAAGLGSNRIDRWGESFTCDKMSACFDLTGTRLLLGNSCALCVHVTVLPLYPYTIRELSI